MSEIELVDKKSFSSEEMLSETNPVKVTIQKKKNFIPVILVIALTLLVIFSLTLSFIYSSSTSEAYLQKNPYKPSLEKKESPKKLNERKVIPYETPNKLDGLLDYILYPYHSDIIKNLDDYEFIRDSLGKVSLKMVFNSNYHGDYALDVHSRSNYHHTLVLIETEKGNRFGGYTSDNFSPQTFGLTSTSIELFKRDNSAFLFNLDSKKIYNIKPSETSRALDCDDYFTLCFGEGDLILRDKFLSSGGLSTFPGHYGDENTQETELTNGEKEFTIKAFEVYNVLFFSEFGDENNKMGLYKNFVK
jgi:hypothetical protein